MPALNTLRPVAANDQARLSAALAEALQGGAPIFPFSPDIPTGELERLQRTVLPADTAVVIRTSGSSGIPKAVALSARALIASAEATLAALGGAGQWLLTLPGHLISGLQPLVRAQLAGIEPIYFHDSFDPAAFIAAASRMCHPRRYVSLVPVQLSRLLDLAERDQKAAATLRGFAAVLVGGQAVPLPLRQRCHELNIALRRSYGMTETAGGCVYDGIEIGDTLVRIRGGEVQLSGSSLALGYLGDEALTAAHFFEDQGARWYRTGDAGELTGGLLTVTGRLDRVIVSGGVNVSLDAVELVVCALPGWERTVALGLPHPEWGEQVSLVRESPHSDGIAPGYDFETVRNEVKMRLGAAAAPVRVTETRTLPRLANGKPALAELQRVTVQRRRADGDG